MKKMLVPALALALAPLSIAAAQTADAEEDNAAMTCPHIDGEHGANHPHGQAGEHGAQAGHGMHHDGHGDDGQSGMMHGMMNGEGGCPAHDGDAGGHEHHGAHGE